MTRHSLVQNITAKVNEEIKVRETTGRNKKRVITRKTYDYCADEVA